MEKKKVILYNLQPRLGDALMLTPVVRDFKKTYPEISLGVMTAKPAIFENNPYVDAINPNPTGTELHKLGPGMVSNGSKTNGLHIAESFGISLESKSEYKLKPSHIKPDIHLSDIEKKQPLVAGEYWVIVPSHGTGYTSKQWVMDRWQQLVDSMPHINFVQTGDLQSNEIILKGKNVCTDLIGKTNVRELFQLIYHSRGVVSLISAPMHIAGAFNKPCVVIAGGREPRTFEAYENHRFISNIGCLPCCNPYACWAGNKDSCYVKMYNAGLCPEVDNKADDFNIRTYALVRKLTSHNPLCMENISVDIVRGAIDQYYAGGVISAPVNNKIKPIRKPIFRMLGNAKFLGGAERSMIMIMKMMIECGYKVEFAARDNYFSPSIISQLPSGVKLTNNITSECDIFMLYASDMVFDFHKPEFNIMLKLNAKKKVMALTYKIGKAANTEWADNWDKYLFLSTEMQKAYLGKVLLTPNGRAKAHKTKVLPPPVDLGEFFDTPLLKDNIGHQYKDEVIISRHSSQGDKKYDKRLLDVVSSCKEKEFIFMPGPSFLNGSPNNATCLHYNQEPVAKFLSRSNLFWYLLPEGYTDQGPRAVMEAMAAGLPVITEDRSGMSDRVNEDTGWFVNYDNCADLINSLTLADIIKKGLAARQHAQANFDPLGWIRELKS